MLDQFLIIAIIVTALALGGSFLIPITIAFFATILISAATERLVRAGLGPVFAMMVALSIIVLVVALVVYSVLGQVDAVAEAWPRYVDRFQSLFSKTMERLDGGVAEKIKEAVGSFSILATVPTLMGSAGGFLATFCLVAIYVGFMLAERTTVDTKVEKMLGADQDVDRARKALNGIVAGIREYIWIKTLMSLLTGGVSYVVLVALGVDFAETWALIIFLLNYIPNIGSILGVIFPALLALIQFDTLWQFLVIAICLSSAQFLIGNVLEPRVMGRTLNLSSFVVIASLAFWAMLWGIVGAFLGVPLTAAIAITCSHIPSWRWLAVLLSEDNSEA